MKRWPECKSLSITSCTTKPAFLAAYFGGDGVDYYVKKKKGVEFFVRAMPLVAARVEVEAINLRDATLDVEVAELEPAASCGCTQAITQPVHVVRLDSLTAAASFLVHRRTLSC